jgi:hypothetical protein
MSLSAIAAVPVRNALGAAGLGTTLKPVGATGGVAMAARVAVMAGFGAAAEICADAWCACRTLPTAAA